MTLKFRASILAFLALSAAAPAIAQSSSVAPPNAAALKHANSYSPLDQINASNFGKLTVAWRFTAGEKGMLRNTPLLVDGVLYGQDVQGVVVALDPATGAVRWKQTVPSTAGGATTRRMEYWRSGNDRRIFSITGEYLYATDAATGQPVATFGTEGRVLLRFDDPRARRYSTSLGPFVVGNVIVVPGNSDGAGDYVRNREAVPEDVRGYDAQTGKLLWTSHVIPREGDPATATWGEDSWRTAGDAGVWNQMSADESLGLVYYSTTSPTATWYGGWRPGDNLYTSSLVAVDYRTGKRVWAYQMVHHDLWDFENVGPALLGDITIDGKLTKVVMQSNKNGFVYVLDRTNGKPVWPTEERKVPASTVPGERISPTQPFPSKPPPLDAQGITENDLIDYTPDLKARALALVKDYVMGPFFTPPSLEVGGKKGSLVTPGAYGAANWNTGAFDPETGIYYGVTKNQGPTIRLVEKAAPNETIGYKIVDRPDLAVDGLPIVKGPYGKITALDMKTGTLAWTVANGDGPRNHPVLKPLNLPPLGVPNRGATALVTKTLVIVGEGSDLLTLAPQADWKWGKKFRAYAKDTGKVLGEIELPSGTLGAAITYMAGGKQFVVVPVGSLQEKPEYVALSLP